MNIFESTIKSYQKIWEEVESRDFTPEEINFVASAVVVQGNYARSIHFTYTNGKYCFIPIEPGSVINYPKETAVNATVDMQRIELVSLKYIGDDPTVPKNTFKIRFKPIQIKPEVVQSFDNPFGI